MKRFPYPALLLLLHFSCIGMAQDTRVLQPDGFEQIELVSEAGAVTPGKTLQVGLLFTLSPEHHTYWRGPGVVGVAPTFKWDLPAGFQVGRTYWPAPEVVDMAGIRANGYHGEVLIITDITPPESLEGKEVTLKVRSSWMACASSCNPGVGDFSITLPVQRSGSPTRPVHPQAARFAETMRAIPPPAPQGWKWQASRKESTITLKLDLPDSDPPTVFENVHFFCDDMQIDSDEPQATSTPQSGKFDLVQKLPVPKFAPKNPDQFSGLLFNAKGWPGLNSNYVEVNIPWSTDPPKHE